MTENSETDLPLPETLQDVQALLKKKAQELLYAPPQHINEIQQEIQKLRVTAGIYREIADNFSDPNLYKEMNLLNRMLTGKDIESEAEKRKIQRESSKASDKLRQNYGLDPESAQRIARVIQGVVGGEADDPAIGNEPEPEPIGPDGIQ